MKPFRIILTIILTVSTGHSFAKRNTSTDSKKKLVSGTHLSTLYYLPRIDVGVYKLNDSDAKTANVVEGFIPFYQTHHFLTFGDIRYYNQSGTPWEGNLAFGFRYLNKKKEIFGLYGSFDRFHSQTKHYFSQATFGFELWFNRFFFGGNGYMTIHPKNYPYNAFNQAELTPVSGSSIYNIIYFEGGERILPGFDVLAGYDMTNHLTLYAGGYYFKKNPVPKVFGPKLRATYTWYSHPSLKFFGVFDRIQLEGQVTHDDVRKTDWYVGVRFSINLGHNSSHVLTRLEQHLVDTIRRDMNVIDVGYTDNQSNFLTNADGSKVTVDLPTSYAEFATEVEASTGVDIVGIDGTLTADLGDNQSLDIIRDLVINGGQYSFIAFGRPYSVAVGNKGEVSVDNTADYFLNIQSTSNIDLEHMTFENTSGPALQTENSSTGALTIDQTIFKGLSDSSNALVKLEGDSNVSINDTTFNFNASSVGSGLDLFGTAGQVMITGNVNSNLDSQGDYLISMAGEENLIISNAKVKNTGAAGILDVELATTGHLSILNSTLEGDGETPIIKLEDTDDPTLKNVTVINTNTTNSEPLIEIAATANIDIDAGELTLENSGVGDSIDESGSLTIENSTITETTGDPVIEIANGNEGTVYVFNSTITNLGSGCIFRIGMSAKAGLTIIDSTLVGTGANATMMLGSSDSMSSYTLTNVSLSNTIAGELIEHTGTAPLILNDSIELIQSGSGDGILLSNGSMMGPHTLTLSDITITGNLSGRLILTSDGSTESISIGDNVTLTNADTGSLIYHEGTGSLTIDPSATLSLSHTGNGNGIVLANTSTMSPQTLNLSNVTITGSMGGDFISVPSSSTASVIIQNGAALTNSGSGGVLNMASSGMNADLTITDSSLETSLSGSVLTLSGAGEVSISGTSTLTSSTGDLISVEGGSGDISVTGISGTPIELDTSGFAFKTNGSTFGHISVEYADSNAPFNFKLSDTSAQGEVTFDNNQLTIGNATVKDNTVVNDFASVIFSSNDSSQLLTVLNFSDNSIDIVRTDNVDTYGLYASGTSLSPVIFTTGIQDNTITIDNSATPVSGSTILVGFYNSNVTLDADFSNNNIDVTGLAGSNLGNRQGTIGMYTVNGFVIGNSANMTNNVFEVQNTRSSGDGAAWYASGSISIAGDFGGASASVGNTFTSSSNASNGYGIWSRNTFNVAGDIGYNQFEASSNGSTSYAWASDSASSVTIGGDFDHNTFSALSNGGSGYGWDMNGSLDVSTGAFSDNIFTASSNNSNGFAWESTGTVNVNTDFTNNDFTASNNVTGTGYGWQSESASTVTIGGNVTNNRLTANSNGNDGYGWDAGAAIAITGNFGGSGTTDFNIFTATGNADDAYGWETTGTVTIDGDFCGADATHQNQFIADSNQNGYGWQSENTVSVVGKFSYNTFQASSNTSTSYGWQSSASTGNGFELTGGDFSYNTFTVASNTGGTSRGWQNNQPIVINNGAFDHNTFTASNNNIGFGWEAKDPVTISGDFSNNDFTASSNTSTSTSTAFETEDTLSVGGDFITNTFTANLNNKTANAWLASGTIDVTGDFSDNTFTASQNDQPDLQNGNGTAWRTSQTITIGGNLGGTVSLDGNTFTASQNGNTGYGWYATGAVNITGNFGGINSSNQGNTFMGSSNGGTGYGFRSTQPITVDGQMSYNSFTASSNTTVGYGWRQSASSGPVNVDGGDFSNNAFTASFNTSTSYGWQTFATVTISAGDFGDNTFTASNNNNQGYGWEAKQAVSVSGDFTGNSFSAEDNTKTGYGWQSDNSVMVGWDFTDNTFIASRNDQPDAFSSKAYGWQSRGAVTITGNFGGTSAALGNHFTAEENGDDGFGWQLTGSSSITVDGSYFGYNEFTSNENGDNGYGWQTTGDVTIAGEFSNNAFNLADNNTSNRGLDINDNFTVDGLFTDNSFTIPSNTKVSNGIDIDVRGTEIAHFKQAVTNNTFDITTTNGNSYDFKLDTRNTAGIYFQDNPSEADLKTVNGNATVNNYGSDNVNFNVGP